MQGRDRRGERRRAGDREHPAPAVRSRAGHVPAARARQAREAGDGAAERGVREREASGPPSRTGSAASGAPAAACATHSR